MKMVEIQDKTYTTEEAHRILWNWLAENPTKDKLDFFEAMGINYLTRPREECYACEDCNSYCKKCPIKWTDEINTRTSCCDSNSLYNKWYEEVSKEKISEIAKQIANLQWKDGGWNETN